MLTAYPHSQIDTGVYEINEFDGASMFLIEGTERALLIDTGVGIGALDVFLRQLTALPVDVLLTHNHRDHVGNAPRFPSVYMGTADIQMGPILRELTTRESRLQFAHHTLEMHPGRTYPWTDADVEALNQEPAVISIGDGFTFNLGGRSVHCISTPGHTPGSLSAIDSQTGILFCGDACNGTLGLGVRPFAGGKHATMAQSYAALTRLAQLPFDHARIFNGHSDYRAQGTPLPASVFPAILEAMEMVLSGQYTSQPKHIASINADVEIVRHRGVELQFHSELIQDLSVL